VARWHPRHRVAGLAGPALGRARRYVPVTPPGGCTAATGRHGSAPGDDWSGFKKPLARRPSYDEVVPITNPQGRNPP